MHQGVTAKCARELKRTEKLWREEVEMSSHSNSETIIPLSAVTITLGGPPLKVRGNRRSGFVKSTGGGCRKYSRMDCFHHEPPESGHRPIGGPLRCGGVP